MDTKKIQLVTFDLDGTMLDDEWAHARGKPPPGCQAGGGSYPLGAADRLFRAETLGGIVPPGRCGGRIEEIAREHFDITLEIVKAEGIPEAPGLTADSAGPAGAGISDGHRVLLG